MDIKIKTNISNEFKETSITINTPELSDKIQKIIKYIEDINLIPKQIIANKNNQIYFINLDEIICFFSKNKCIYARTQNDIYKLKYKLYELDNMFNQKNFIRISNSCIVNINQVEYFDISILGTIIVKLKDGTKENVSKRNISTIMKLLKERGHKN